MFSTFAAQESRAPLETNRAGSNREASSPSITAEGFTNAATFLPGPIAPGEIVSIFGAGLGPEIGVGAALNEQGRLSKSLAGTDVLFDGVAAPLFFVRGDQLNVQVPYSLAGSSSTTVQVFHNGVASNPVELPVVASAPGVFAYEGGKYQGIIFNEDHSINTSINPAKPGSIVVFYATGEGQLIPAGIDGKLAEAPYPTPLLPVSVAMGGVPVTDMPYAGAAPGFAGLLQVNARIPQSVPPGRSVPLVLTIGGHDSQAGLTMAVASGFEIFDLRASASNGSQGATLTLTVDFVDPSGSASRGGITVNFDIDNGGTKGLGEFDRSGVSPGQTSGTMTLTFMFVGTKFRNVTKVPIVVSLVNEAGVESNQAVGSLAAP
jgi:uncharacterized protein (TIGR03437 family)